MTLTFTEEQDQLRESVRHFVADKASSGSVRAVMETAAGHDPEVWTQMAQQLGLHGLAVPEVHGGSGYGPVELGIVLEETGRALLPGPFFATVALAGQALTQAPDGEAAARWLPGIADGTITATLAPGSDGGPAARVDDRGALTGEAMFVLDGATADLLLVVAQDADGAGLWAVDPAAGGVTRTALEALDPTRRLGRIDLDGAPGLRVDEGTDGAGFVRRVLDLAVVALAAEQVGGGQACLDAAVEYAGVRVQFGRPIGSFQAIKHMCADMLLEIESARSAAYHAQSCAEGAAGDATELPIAAAVAASYCAEAFTYAAKENLQIHGGIGYTWEHDAHLYLKRAKSSELLFGTPATHRAALADLVGMR